MEAYVPKKLPYEYVLDKNTLKLLMDAYEVYGEYKGFLKSMSFDYKLMLESMLINEMFYSFKIDNSKYEKEDMFYIQYMMKNNEVTQFKNMISSFMYGITNIIKNDISILALNQMHKMMFTGCKKTNIIKGSGHLRKKQTYLLKPGIAGSSISFIPVIHNELNKYIKNYCEYFNETEDDPFISVAFSHMQFERLHPYITGNGKLGRLLLVLQLSKYKKEPPILFISESMYNLKNTYFTSLSTVDEKENERFIKFFLECIIDQCNINIKKIKKINKIYERDIKKFKKDIGGTTIYKVYPSIIRRIVFSTADIVNDTKLHINSVNKVLNKLVESGYLYKEKRKGTNRVTFKYISMHDILIS